MIFCDANLLVDAYEEAEPSPRVTRAPGIHSCDQDFGRFTHLRWRNPLQPKPA